MLDALLMRLDAPLVAFGGVVVDNRGETRLFPARSMLTGLLGNALGLDYRDTQALEALQRRLIYAVRCDKPGEVIRDYQTVDLSQSFLWQGWTTYGHPQGRQGEAEHDIARLMAAAERGEAPPRATKTTVIRYRDYLADAVYTVALALDPAMDDPAVEGLAAALRAPARPLFIGRKPCLPAEPIFLGRMQAASLREALIAAPL